MIKSITQSFIKDMQDYLDDKLCGNVLKEKWENDKLIDLDSDAVDLGCYFEYVLTLILTGKGSLPKNNKVPQAKLTQAGKKTTDYDRADKNANRVAKYINAMGLVVIDAGLKLEKDGYSGTIDLICKAKKTVYSSTGNVLIAEGEIIIIDLKYSGLLENKWEPMGWAGLLMDGFHIQKEYHGIQAKQYSYVGELPFFYLVTHSKNETDIMFFRVPISEEMIGRHLEHGKYLYDQFVFLSGTNQIKPSPEVATCLKCPLFATCEDKALFPLPKTVTL